MDFTFDFNAIKNGFLNLDHKRFYLDYRGRVSRRDYILYGVIPMVVLALLSTLFGVVVNMIVSILLIWPTIALVIKRLHDWNKSGWFALLIAVPLVNFIFAAFMLFVKGTDGPNRFGPKVF